MNYLSKIEEKIHEQVSRSIKVTEERGCVVLNGELEDWENIVRAGSLAVTKKSLGVINNIKLKGFAEVPRIPTVIDKIYDGATPDILIIGAGITGCAIARELSKYKYNVMLLEKEYDVALAASSRNDGDVHVGIDLHKGGQKLPYTLRGNDLYNKLCSDLQVELHRTGHTIMFYKKWENLLIYPLIKLKAKILGIKGVRFVKPRDLPDFEKGAPSWAVGAVFMPSGAEVSPYKLTVALAENAVANGINLCLNTYVKGMYVSDGGIKAVHTNRGTIKPRLIINAAGVHSDIIAELAGDRTFTIHPRKGTNIILDKKCEKYAMTSMTKSPFSKFANDKKRVEDSKQHTKGGGIVHTIDGNILVGPNATETPYREDNTTNKEDIDAIINKLKRVAEKLSYSDIITYFSGIRASTYEEDFVVRKGIYTKNIIEAAGIQSPGLTAAPAIAEDVAAWSCEILGGAEINDRFNPVREAVPKLSNMEPDERAYFISKNPAFGEIVCRCEEISLGEILCVLDSPVPVYTLDSIKRRVRPGMGRCQGGFCSPLVMKILAEKAGKSIEEIKKAGDASYILCRDTKRGDNE